MTDDELVDDREALLEDLDRLLELGLVYVDTDQRDAGTEADPATVPRFYLTAKGRDLSSADRLFKKVG